MKPGTAIKPMLLLVVSVVAVGCVTVPADRNEQAQQWATHVAWARYPTWAPVTTTDTTNVASEPDAVRAMIAHHQDAIDAASGYKPNASTSDLTAFAEQIIRVQTGQVAEMIGWLQQRGEPVDGGMWEPMFCDLADFGTDLAFLETMIAHHYAAVSMYQQFLDDQIIVDDRLGLLMRRIGRGQTGEIEWMTQRVAAQ